MAPCKSLPAAKSGAAADPFGNRTKEEYKNGRQLEGFNEGKNQWQSTSTTEKSTEEEPERGKVVGEKKPKMFLSAEEGLHDPSMNRTDDFTASIVWKNIVFYIVIHVGAAYGLYLLLIEAKWFTLIWCWLLYVAAGFGITAGAHRLWAHKSFKASKRMRYLLAILNTMACQNDVIEWCRDHRGHHKWSETNADPHNSNRGLFFAHMGWLLVRKHPLVKEKGRTVDMTDLTSDPVLIWQRQNYYSLLILFVLYLPTVVPNIIWGETIVTSYFTAVVFRYCFLLHATWTINSIAHRYGNKPYDRRISPTQNLSSAVVSLGEGWHNYHHTFPQDYRASENPYLFNMTTAFIDSFAAIGWVWDRRTTAEESVQMRKANNNNNNNNSRRG